ncbi:MAG: hypothetical protein JXA99_03845 [Candidatus Lokiarchaeota archaeon]|nr:hypothetical protein [Candidatus Lokiarchaeota archaeon]
MSFEIILALIGILATIVGWFIIKNIKKTNKRQANKISVKGKKSNIIIGGDIVGGDKINNENRE